MLTVVSFVVLLLMLIFVHELGHFLAAKLLGVRVEKFSLGFPPKMLAKTIGETEYQLAWLPLGGYVKLFGEDPSLDANLSEDDKKRSFAHKPIWARSIIVFAGPLFNLAFAVLILWALLWQGGENHLKPVLGRVEAGSPALAAGLRPFDEITAINGRPVIYFDQLTEIIAANKAEAPLNLTVNRQGQTLNISLIPKKVEEEDIFGLIRSRYVIGVRPYRPAVIGQLPRGSRAGEAGLKSGDRVLTVDGAPVNDWLDVVAAIEGPNPRRASESPPEVKPLVFTVERAGRKLNIAVTPKIETIPDRHGQTIYIPTVGIYYKDEFINEPYGFFRAAWGGLEDAGGMIVLTVQSLYNLLRGQISVKTMGGPLFIADVAGKRAAEGLASFFYLAAFISVNLGLLNLLPLPVLDGGQLVFFGLEAVRRRPLSLKTRERIQVAGLALLGMLMIMVMFNDASRLATKFLTNWKVGSSPAQSEGPPPVPVAPVPEPAETVQP